MKSLRIISGSALLLLLIAGLFVYRASFARAFGIVGDFFRRAIDPSFSYAELVRLKVENKSLLFEVSKSRDASPSIASSRFLEGSVYSRYPSNERSLVVINQGTTNGIAVGMPVFADAEGNFLFGRVSAVRDFQSEVQTLSDAAWKSSVEIGDKKIKALFVGGNSPHLELAPKEGEWKEGDSVRNVSPDFPLGVLLGTVGKVKEDANAIWKQATVALSAVPLDVVRLYVLIRFP